MPKRFIVTVVTLFIILIGCFFYWVSKEVPEDVDDPQTRWNDGPDIKPQDPFSPKKEQTLTEEYPSASQSSDKQGWINPRPGDISHVLEDAAATKKSVFLGEGEYVANAHIEHGEALVVAGSGAKTLVRPKDPSQPVIRVQGASADVSDLVFSDGTVGILAEDSDIRISRIGMRRFSANAMYLFGGKPDISRLYASENGTAIKASSIRDGAVKDSILRNGSKSGIELFGSFISVSSCDIFGNRSYGIFADAESEPRLFENYILGNGGYDIRLERDGGIYR